MNRPKKHNDFEICLRRGGGGYTLYETKKLLEARSHVRALEFFLRAFDSWEILKPVRVRGDVDTVMKADVCVYRHATQDTYKAFFDLIPKQNRFQITDDARGGGIYVHRLAPCEFSKRETEV